MDRRKQCDCARSDHWQQCGYRAGSVVTKDIPDWSLAAGNPCRVLRQITDDDKKKLFRDEEIDEEAWADIVGRMGNDFANGTEEK